MASKLTNYLKDFHRLHLTRPISDKVRLLEILAVVLTAVGKFVFMDYLNWRLPFVLVAIVCWAIYVVYRYRKDEQVLVDWGFRCDTMKSVLKWLWPFAAGAVLVFFVIGFLQGTINLSWHIIPLLITYPIWGTVQQFLTIGIIAGNLSTLKSVRLKKGTVIFLTALLFSLVHYPSVWLLIGTFVLALFYGYVYLKVKNLYVLGLFHGWLGALFYYTVVGRDPFAEIFLRYLH